MVSEVETSLVAEIKSVSSEKIFQHVFNPSIDILLMKNDKEYYTDQFLSCAALYDSKYYIILSYNDRENNNSKYFPYNPPYQFEIVSASYEKLISNTPNKEYHTVDLEVPFSINDKNQIKQKESAICF